MMPAGERGGRGGEEPVLDHCASNKELRGREPRVAAETWHCQQQRLLLCSTPGSVFCWKSLLSPVDSLQALLPHPRCLKAFLHTFIFKHGLDGAVPSAQTEAPGAEQVTGNTGHCPASSCSAEASWAVLEVY